MALASGTTESANSVDSGYSWWRLDTIPVEIHVHFGVIDGIKRDIFENPHDATAGVLLGHGEAGTPAVLWIEGYRRREEETPKSEPNSTVVGAWSGSALAVDPDEPAVSSEEPWEFFLRIVPGASGILQVQCFFPGAAGRLEPALPLFPFRGTPAPATAPEDHAEHHRPGRLVPDFDRAGDPPPYVPELFAESRPESPASSLFRRFWPMLAALALLGGVVWLLLTIQTGGTVTPPSTGTATRPLGLYVDPTAQTWRISWNRDATVLHGAKSVRLFVKNGDDQNLLELSRQDLESATYRYEAGGRDVTFRLEATGKDGRVTAESFRLLKTADPETPPPLPASPAAVSATTPPRASYRVAPVVAAAIRPRIQGRVAIDVRVQIDSRGRVTAAVPARKPHGSLEIYLADRAVRAAGAWRFHPAVKDGKAAAGAQTIHFVFER